MAEAKVIFHLCSDKIMLANSALQQSVRAVLVLVPGQDAVRAGHVLLQSVVGFELGITDVAADVFVVLFGANDLVLLEIVFPKIACAAVGANSSRIALMLLHYVLV